MGLRHSSLSPPHGLITHRILQTRRPKNEHRGEREILFEKDSQARAGKTTANPDNARRHKTTQGRVCQVFLED